MKKFISIILIESLLILMIFSNIQISNASDLDSVINSMSGVSSAPEGAGDTKTAKVINNVVGIIQLTGTGISVIVISLLGIKYLLASPSDKADVKRNILPIIIGCALLFAAVNIVGIIENVTSDAELTGSVSTSTEN